MIFRLISHLFVEEAGTWIQKIPTPVLWGVVVATAFIAWIVPDVIPGLEEGIAAVIYVKIAHELLRRRGSDPKELEKKP
jgi:hypothetical protein